MSKAEILLIESSRASAPSFSPALERKGYEVRILHKVDQVLSAAKQKHPDVLILDAASMRTSGTRMSRKLRSTLDGVPIILISPQGSSPDRGNGASITLIQPFTPRKLLNRIERLLPGDERYMLSIGPIKLDMVKCRVRCNKKESRITPKLAKLLELFMQNPGRLLTRKAIIRKVWHTDYTGDTRTLDVHMSWLRQAIEADPNNPRLIKTIRGMGYRLDLPKDNG